MSAQSTLPQSETLQNAVGPLTASIVICAYTVSRWNELSRAIDSVANQTTAPIQTIVVVDYNDELRRRLERQFPWIEVVANVGPQGLSGARNTGVAISRAEIVVFLDDDAWAEPTWLASILKHFVSRDVLGIGGLVLPAWEDEAPIWLPPEFYWVVGCSYTGLPESGSEIRNPIGANMAFRREVFSKVGAFRTDVGRNIQINRALGCEETELGIRVRQKIANARILHASDAVVNHLVPRQRASWAYFRSRCYSEGISKAQVARYVGQVDGLSSERGYVQRALPAAACRSLRGLFFEPRHALGQLTALVVGLAWTGAGYFTGMVTHRRLIGARLRGREFDGSGAHVAGEALSGSAWVQLDMTVSVVVCAYDFGRFEMILEALASLRRQNLTPCEVIVVVDGDHELHEALLKTTSGERLLLLEENQGLSTARNVGAAEALGTYVAFLDDDAVADESWLRRLVDSLGNNVAGVSGRSVPNWEGSTPNWFPEELLWAVGCSHKGLPTAVTDVRNFFGGSSIVRRSLFTEVGGFDESLGRKGSGTQGCEDTDFCLRVRTRRPEVRFRHNPEATIHHFVPSNRQTVGYVARRCYSEGRTKALLANRFGVRAALIPERTFLTSTVTDGAAGYLGAAIKGDRYAIARVIVLFVGIAAAGVGFVMRFAKLKIQTAKRTGFHTSGVPDER